MFGMLMGASGVGPKLALSALSGLSVREMTTAVVEGDVRRLSSVSGIGRKTAERLVVELRDKFSEGEALEALSGTAGTGSDDKRLRDAVLALAALGYREDDARKKASAVLAKAGSEALTVEDVIRRALGG
jgi:Holliday junction DNA helicase RuvA